jgi:hypothetical protein
MPVASLVALRVLLRWATAATMLGGPSMGAVGMSLGQQIGPEFQAFDFTHARRTHEVFRGGSGPAVLVLHEIPGLHPGVIDFSRRLIAAGYTVYLPSLFGRPAAPATGREIARSLVQVCVAREFTKLVDRTSLVTGWLRALAASAYCECGGPGVGVIGMCFTGGFALATALERPAIRPESPSTGSWRSWPSGCRRRHEGGHRDDREPKEPDAAARVSAPGPVRLICGRSCQGAW